MIVKSSLFNYLKENETFFSSYPTRMFYLTFLHVCQLHLLLGFGIEIKWKIVGSSGPQSLHLAAI